MKDINVINFFEENNLNFSSNFNLGVTNLPSKLITLSLTDIFTSDGMVIGFLAKRDMINIR